MSDKNESLRPFVSMLGALATGAAEKELDLAQAEMVRAVRVTGKTGTLTLTLKYEPAGRGMEAFHVDYTVKRTVPMGARPLSLFFPTSDNRLVRTDPNQLEMPLRAVPPANVTELKTVRVETVTPQEVVNG